MVHIGQLQITMHTRIYGSKRAAIKCCGDHVENGQTPEILQGRYELWGLIKSYQHDSYKLQW